MIMKIKLGSKTYTATSLPASVSREAMKISRDALELAKMGDEIKEATDSGDYDNISDLLEKLIEIKDRKAALVCKVYDNKFDVDTLLDNASDADIDQQINALTTSISSMVAKK